MKNTESYEGCRLFPTPEGSLGTGLMFMSGSIPLSVESGAGKCRLTFICVFHPLLGQ